MTAVPSPPTFVPRTGASDPDDGYIVVVVHQDGDKEIQVFQNSIWRLMTKSCVFTVVM